MVADLRSNPLMLGLMCNIYRGENYIPRNRPDLYEKCAVMLFERWDKHRGIEIGLPFEAHINPAMKYLAYWIYSEPGLDSGVTEQALTSKAADYLQQWRYGQRDDAEAAARSFIEFCRGRAWVFTDTGTQRAGERLYQFTHRTFLEYFAAGHLARIHSTAATLSDALMPRVERREWDVVVQLALQILNKNAEGAGDAFLEVLVPSARRPTSARGLNRLVFALRCLEFTIPRAALVERLVRIATSVCLAERRGRTNGGPRGAQASRDESISEELRRALVNCASENRDLVAATLRTDLVHRARSRPDDEALDAIELGLYLQLAFYGRGGLQIPSEDVVRYWADVSKGVCDEVRERLTKLSTRHFRAAYDAVRTEVVTLSGFVALHGAEALFASRDLRRFAQMVLPPIGSLIQDAAAVPDRADLPSALWRSDAAAALGELGRIVIDAPLPWMPAGRIDRFYPDHIYARYRHRRDDSADLSHLRGDAMFGAFAMLAPGIEAFGTATAGHAERRGFVAWLNHNKERGGIALPRTLLARLREVGEDEMMSEVHGSDLQPRQQQFAIAWARREFDLVGPRRSRAAKG